MSTDTSSLFQMDHERGWQRGVGNLLRGELVRELAREFARWLKSKRVWLHILIWLLIINLILFFTATGLRKATRAAAAAGESPPKVETVMLHGVFVGMLVAVGVMIIVRGAIVAERRPGTAAWRATTWQMQSKPGAASRWARECGLDAGKEPIDSSTEYIRLVRILLTQESLEQATRLLQRPLEAAETGEWFWSAIEILSLQALAYQARGESISAMAALERALALAELEQTAPSKPQTLNQTLVEPLSERELEILELIAEGLTNPQIASRLYLATNTVKTHTRNIYGKLDAHNRTQAVAQARALGVFAST